MSPTVRDAAPADLDALARLWFDGWQDGHAAIVPTELARIRTLSSFRERLAEAFDQVRVAEVDGRVAGFWMRKDDELYQFYVAAGFRGSPVAPVLMDDALARLAGAGLKTVWLACAIGNDRAARFYEKRGWQRMGVVTSELVTPGGGTFPLDVWRYEIALPAIAQTSR